MNPQQFQGGIPTSRASGGPPQFVPGVTSGEEERQARKLIETRRRRQIPELVGVPFTWARQLIHYGAEVIAQKVAQYLIEDLRRTEIFTRNPAILQPTVDSYVFDVFGGIRATAPINLAGVGGPWITIAQFIVPNGYQGVLYRVGHDLSAPAAWPQIEWRLVKNTSAVGNYSNWCGQIGLVNNPCEQFFVAIEHNSTVLLEARNLNFGGALTAFGRIGGWYWLVNQYSDRKWEQALKD